MSAAIAERAGVLEKTGLELVAHLKATGTGTDRLNALESFLAENPEASASDLVAYMQQVGMQAGTVSKAGKFAYGPQWSLFQPGQDAGDEIARLNAEAAELRKQLAESNATAARLTREADNLRNQLAEVNKRYAPQQVKANEKPR